MEWIYKLIYIDDRTEEEKALKASLDEITELCINGSESPRSVKKFLDMTKNQESIIEKYRLLMRTKR